MPPPTVQTLPEPEPAPVPEPDPLPEPDGGCGEDGDCAATDFCDQGFCHPQPPVDCVGSWSACTASCEAAGDRAWTELIAPTGGGVACPDDSRDCAVGEDACWRDACGDSADCDHAAGEVCAQGFCGAGPPEPEPETDALDLCGDTCEQAATIGSPELAEEIRRQHMCDQTWGDGCPDELPPAGFTTASKL